MVHLHREIWKDYNKRCGYYVAKPQWIVAQGNENWASFLPQLMKAQGDEVVTLV